VDYDDTTMTTMTTTVTTKRTHATHARPIASRHRISFIPLCRNDDVG